MHEVDRGWVHLRAEPSGVKVKGGEEKDRGGQNEIQMILCTSCILLQMDRKKV